MPRVRHRNPPHRPLLDLGPIPAGPEQGPAAWGRNRSSSSDEGGRDGPGERGRRLADAVLVVVTGGAAVAVSAVASAGLSSAAGAGSGRDGRDPAGAADGDAVERVERDRDLLLVVGIGAFRSGSGRVCSTRSGGRGRWSTTRWLGSTGSGLPATARWARHRWAVRRPARIPLNELKKGEAFASLRGTRGPDRAGTRRRQPPRLQAPRANARLRPDRAARADPGAAAGTLPRPRL
jgi:hypothetical protein